MEYKRGRVTTTVLRLFRIRVGLRVGYEPGSPVYHPDHAAEIVLRWNEERRLADLPYLPGSVVECTFVNVYGNAASGSARTEPGIWYEGEISGRLANMPDSEIEQMLEELAGTLLEELGQERVEIRYNDRTWPLVCK